MIKVITTQRVQVQNMHLQDGRLFIKGLAPSQDAANMVWNEIKRINPKLDDILADFPVDPSVQTKAAQQPQGTQLYTVKTGRYPVEDQQTVLR